MYLLYWESCRRHVTTQHGTSVVLRAFIYGRSHAGPAARSQRAWRVGQQVVMFVRGELGPARQDCRGIVAAAMVWR